MLSKKLSHSFVDKGHSYSLKWSRFNKKVLWNYSCQPSTVSFQMVYIHIRMCSWYYQQSSHFISSNGQYNCKWDKGDKDIEFLKNVEKWNSLFESVFHLFSLCNPPCPRQVEPSCGPVTCQLNCLSAMPLLSTWPTYCCCSADLSLSPTHGNYLKFRHPMPWHRHREIRKCLLGWWY